MMNETASVGAEEYETFAARGDENQELALLSDRAGAAPSEESEGGRRRRRRRRRRGERPLGDNLSLEAPQPTDDGLAVVAEIGGNLVASSADADAFDRRGLRSGEERHRRSRGLRVGRSRFRRVEETAVETSSPESNSHTPIVLEQEFARSEADYSATPTVEEFRSSQETRTKISPVAEAEENEIEGQMTRATSSEPAVASFSTAPATTAAEALAAPLAPEPPRPRRSGWWQRARASVIGK